jgi:phosphomannomutase
MHVKSWLEDKLEESSFPLRTGLHIEERPGMVNFSVVGRNATLGERKLYVKHDKQISERNIISDLLNKEFPELIARPGGETGIDISPKGADKSQIVNDFDLDDVLYFYGDRMDLAGNDYPLKKVIIDNDLGFAITVDGWKDTWSKLKCI